MTAAGAAGAAALSRALMASSMLTILFLLETKAATIAGFLSAYRIRAALPT